MTEPSRRISSSGRTSSKRISTVPAAPKPPTSIDPSAIIANHAHLAGTYPITIGVRSVLNPYSRVHSSAGPVEIGDGAIVWEKAVIGAAEFDKKDGEGESRCVLRKNVVVETAAVVCAEEVGEGTVVESLANVGKGARIGKFCKISAHSKIPPNTVIADYTVVLSNGVRRTDRSMLEQPEFAKLKMEAHEKQLAGLAQLIPSTLAKWQ